jgi:hypothetical protein
VPAFIWHRNFIFLDVRDQQQKKLQQQCRNKFLKKFDPKYIEQVTVFYALIATKTSNSKK